MYARMPVQEFYVTGYYLFYLALLTERTESAGIADDQPDSSRASRTLYNLSVHDKETRDRRTMYV